MSTFFLVLHIFTCVVLVFVVLIQSGKEGGIGVMGGGGSSQTIFGSSGGANFFTKFTSGTAAVFMITSIILTVTKGGKKASVFGNIPAANAATAPVQQPPAPTTQPPSATAPAAPAAPAKK
jgi:preprotein translocase subunit SecG